MLYSPLICTIVVISRYTEHVQMYENQLGKGETDIIFRIITFIIVEYDNGVVFYLPLAHIPL